MIAVRDVFSAELVVDRGRIVDGEAEAAQEGRSVRGESTMGTERKLLACCGAQSHLETAVYGKRQVIEPRYCLP